MVGRVRYTSVAKNIGSTATARKPVPANSSVKDSARWLNRCLVAP